jgi:hypothetical protein
LPETDSGHEYSESEYSLFPMPETIQSVSHTVEGDKAVIPPTTIDLRPDKPLPQADLLHDKPERPALSVYEQSTGRLDVDPNDLRDLKILRDRREKGIDPADDPNRTSGELARAEEDILGGSDGWRDAAYSLNDARPDESDESWYERNHDRLAHYTPEQRRRLYGPEPRLADGTPMPNIPTHSQYVDLVSRHRAQLEKDRLQQSE